MQSLDCLTEKAILKNSIYRSTLMDLIYLSQQQTSVLISDEDYDYLSYYEMLNIKAYCANQKLMKPFIYKNSRHSMLVSQKLQRENSYV